MRKISTVFKKDPSNLALVTTEINPENSWVFSDEYVRATRKWDGTAAAIMNGELFKRYDVKKGREVPAGAIPCQEPDPITGHWPHWVKCDREKKEDKYFFEGFDSLTIHGESTQVKDGTYELVGPKVNGNKEHLFNHELKMHGNAKVGLPKEDLTFEGIKYALLANDIEGIVFHHPDGRMAKIRKSDFGIKR